MRREITGLGLLLLFLFCLVATGCGGGGSNKPAVIATPVTTTRSYGALQFTLATQSAVRRGTTLPITLTVKNTGTSSVQMVLTGFSSVATVASGNTLVWESDAGMAHPAISFVKTLAPNETQAFTHNWNTTDNSGNPAGNGNYTVNAWMTGTTVDGVKVNASTDLSASPATVTVTDTTN